MTMFITRNRFINIAVFVANNYFIDGKLIRLTMFGGIGVVDLFMSKIATNEI